MMSARVTDSPTRNVCSRRYPSSTFNAFCTEAIAASSFCTLQLTSSTDRQSCHHCALTCAPFVKHDHFFRTLRSILTNFRSAPFGHVESGWGIQEDTARSTEVHQSLW